MQVYRFFLPVVQKRAIAPINPATALSGERGMLVGDAKGMPATVVCGEGVAVPVVVYPGAGLV